MLLNDLIPQKAQQTREEAVSFESSLASEFRSLTSKSGENLSKVNDQVDLLIEQAEKENEIANRVAKLSAMFSKNSLLETLVYSKINSKLDQFPKKTEEDEVKPPSVSPAPKQNKPKNKPKKPKFSIPFLPKKKMAAGGITVPSPYDTAVSKKTNKLSYADILQLPLQASGITALAKLGEFIKGTGVLGGFFAPYFSSVVNPFALSLGVNQNTINTLVGSPIRKATLDLQNEKKNFAKAWF